MPPPGCVQPRPQTQYPSAVRTTGSPDDVSMCLGSNVHGTPDGPALIGQSYPRTMMYPGGAISTRSLFHPSTLVGVPRFVCVSIEVAQQLGLGSIVRSDSRRSTTKGTTCDVENSPKTSLHLSVAERRVARRSRIDFADRVGVPELSVAWILSNAGRTAAAVRFT